MASPKYKMHMDGEEFLPYEERDEGGKDTFRQGREQHPTGSEMGGKVANVEPSEHDGLHRLTVHHGDGGPISVVHIPEGHGFEVGHSVTVHVSHAGREGQDIIDESEDNR